MKPLKRLDEVYDLEDMTCEKHPGKKWPHKVSSIGVVGFMKTQVPYVDCAGPGIPKLRKTK